MTPSRSTLIGHRPIILAHYQFIVLTTRNGYKSYKLYRSNELCLVHYNSALSYLFLYLIVISYSTSAAWSSRSRCCCRRPRRYPRAGGGRCPSGAGRTRGERGRGGSEGSGEGRGSAAPGGRRGESAPIGRAAVTVPVSARRTVA